MPRWNKTKQQRVIEILDNKIKNLEPSFRQKLIDQLADDEIADNMKQCHSHITRLLDLPATGARTKEYWISRGWSIPQSTVKAKIISKSITRKSFSPFSREFWTNKINPLTNQLYTSNEADFERNSMRPIRPEYWIKKGFDENVALSMSIDTKSRNNILGAAGSKSRTDLEKRTCSKRTVEYWEFRGYSKEDAKEKVSHNQRFFSKNICIEKHGEERGIKIWQDRQDCWQETLNAKSLEEKSRINRLKLTKGITVSKAEKEIFAEIKKVIPHCEHQFTLSKDNKKQFVYDIMAYNRIIEYYGDFWHSNPSKFNENYINPRTKIKAVVKWIIDKAKIQFAEDQGYKVLVIWESDFKRDKEGSIKQCIQFLTQ